MNKTNVFSLSQSLRYRCLMAMLIFLILHSSLFVPCFSVTAYAVPALRVKRAITLADGTQKQVMLVGDENMHFYLDAENNAYILGGNECFVKADLEKLQTRWAERLAVRNNRRVERAAKRGMNILPIQRTGGSDRFHRAQWGAEQNPISGQKKGLVILVNFANKDINAAHDRQFYNDFFNTVGFSKEGNVGSVHDYFYECSYGQFDLTFDVYGPVTVSREYSYYGENDSEGYDLRPAEMVVEACASANKIGADFSKYDWDGDGVVDQVFLVYAGYGEHMGAPANTVWPHESSLSEEAMYGDGSGPVEYDGVTIDTYAVTSELLGTTGSKPAGIGTACHEFSHCMCLPDFYDTAEKTYGMDFWDVMDYGSYSGAIDGGCPAPYTSYERMYCGWLTPTILNDACTVTDMKPLYETPEAYIIYNDNNRNEYYMLENRQGQGFGAYDPAKGMLILHIFFSSSAWTNNTVNTSSVQRMTIIPADGVLSSFTNNADTWPGKTGNTALTDSSTPAATLYVANTDGRKFMGKPIEEIEESRDGLISFLFNGGLQLETPIAMEPTGLRADGFTANWTDVEGATAYKVQLTATDLEAQERRLSDLTLLHEDFSGFNNGKMDEGTTDIAESLDQYTSTQGWDGKKLYTTPNNEVKMGTRYSEGYIFTPWLTTGSRTVTLVFTVRRYGKDLDPVQVVFGEDDTGDRIAEFALTDEATRHIVTTTVEGNTCWWGLTCDGRCYISEMVAYEGEVTEAQIEAGLVSSLYTETVVVQTEGTSYQFTGLSNTRKYSYIVCAVSEKVTGKWSNSIEVLLPMEEDAVAGLPGESLMLGKCYDLTGRKILLGDLQQKKGIYILNGKKYLK